MEDLDDDTNYEMFKFLSNVRKKDPRNPWLEEFCLELKSCKFPNDFKIDSKVGLISSLRRIFIQKGIGKKYYIVQLTLDILI